MVFCGKCGAQAAIENAGFCSKCGQPISKPMTESQAEQTPTCRVCGRRMSLMDKESQRWYCYEDDEVWLGNETVLAAKYRSEPSSFEVVYVDGFANREMSGGVIALTDSSLNILFENPQTELKISYTSIESLSVNLEREITALRTFLVGPTFAAWLKKETKTLAIGFRDELKLIQTPRFVLYDNDHLARCYNSIMKQIRKNRRTES